MRVSAVFIVTQLTTVPAATFNGIAHIDQRADRRAMGRISVADAQFDFKDYELTDVCFDCLRPTPDEMYNCTLKFNWYDPNSKLENDITNCSCSTSWHWDGVAATQGPRNNYNIDTYDICFRGPETFFEMKVTNFVHGKFSLSMAHRYKDSHNFTIPWIYPTTFATPNFSLPLLGKDKEGMTYYNAGPIPGPITQLTD